MAKKIQLFRNSAIQASKGEALVALKGQLTTAKDGEIMLVRYQDEQDVKTIIGVASSGIGSGTGLTYTIFDSEAVPADVEKEIQEVKSYIDQKIEGLDAQDTAEARSFVTEVSEENGVITVKRGAVTSTGATITITDGLDGGINLEVVSSALTQYVGKDAIKVGAESDGQKEISLKLNAADKVLTQDASGLLANINLTWSTSDGLKLIGKEGIEIAKIPATYFIKDGMLENVELVQLSEGPDTNPSGLTDGTYLKFTFNTDGGSKEIYVNVTSLIDIYTGTNGVKVSGKEISAVKDPSSEGFLDITAAGIKVTGIQDAINEAKGLEQAAIDKIEKSVGLSTEGDHITTSGNYTSKATTIAGEIDALDKQVKTNADDIAAIKAYTVNGKAISTNPTLTGADIQLSGYTRSESANKELNIATGDTVNVAFGKLEKAILDNEEVCSKAFDAVATAVGLEREGMTYVAPEGSNYLGGASSVKDADSKLDAAIKTVSDKVTGIESDKNYVKTVIVNGVTGSTTNNTATVTIDGGDITLTDYVKGSDSTDITVSDTINAAFGKVENKISTLDGNVLKQVVAGDGISVTAKSTNSQTISISENAVWDCGVY